MSKFSQFWVYQDGSSQRLLMATSLPISFNDNTKVVHVIEYSALEQAEVKIKYLEAKLAKSKEALHKIADQDFRCNRSGESVIAFNALNELGW